MLHQTVEVPAPTSGRMVHLVSQWPGHRITVKHAVDYYDSQNQRRTVQEPWTIQFEHGHAQVPEEWMDYVRSRPQWEHGVWLADDAGRPHIASGPQVKEGMVTVASRKPDRPPIPKWDEMGAREIEPLLNSGQVDLTEAMLWEIQHDNRSLVVMAIQRAIVALTGEGDVAEVASPAPERDPSSGFVTPLPDDAKGV